MTFVDLDVETPIDLTLTQDASMARGAREYLTGETPRLRAVCRSPRTGEPMLVDSVTLVYLRDGEGSDVETSQAFTADSTGVVWTYQVAALGTADRYTLLVEASFVAGGDTLVVRATDTIVVSDP